MWHVWCLQQCPLNSKNNMNIWVHSIWSNTWRNCIRDKLVKRGMIPQRPYLGWKWQRELLWELTFSKWLVILKALKDWVFLWVKSWPLIWSCNRCRTHITNLLSILIWMNLTRLYHNCLACWELLKAICNNLILLQSKFWWSEITKWRRRARSMQKGNALKHWV